jgi:small subunit ribosomal protein S6e
MANFKIVVSDPKSRKAFQKEIEQKASGFMGKRIGDKVKGDSLGIAGYEFEVTGGSDAQGFPMRRDVEGIARKRLLLAMGPGFHPESRGQRKRKSIRGNTVSASTSQINVKIVTYGSKPIEELIGKKEKKEKLTEDQKKEKLKDELSGMLDDKAPEKSRSEQILEEQAKKEKPAEAKPEEKPSGENKPEEPKKEEPAEKKAEPEDKPAQEEKPEQKEEAKKEEPKKK